MPVPTQPQACPPALGAFYRKTIEPQVERVEAVGEPAAHRNEKARGPQDPRPSSAWRSSTCSANRPEKSAWRRFPPNQESDREDLRNLTRSSGRNCGCTYWNPVGTCRHHAGIFKEDEVSPRFKKGSPGLDAPDDAPAATTARPLLLRLQHRPSLTEEPPKSEPCHARVFCAASLRGPRRCTGLATMLCHYGHARALSRDSRWAVRQLGRGPPHRR
jgi:hypothetical protein